jgi:hypothetical protein
MFISILGNAAGLASILRKTPPTDSLKIIKLTEMENALAYRAGAQLRVPE